MNGKKPFENRFVGVALKGDNLKKYPKHFLTERNENEKHARVRIQNAMNSCEWEAEERIRNKYNKIEKLSNIENGHTFHQMVGIEVNQNSLVLFSLSVYFLKIKLHTKRGFQLMFVIAFFCFFLFYILNGVCVYGVLSSLLRYHPFRFHK